jgi:ABC-type Fe3+/spermidine/putrescine transport system ATPase subunit
MLLLPERGSDLQVFLQSGRPVEGERHLAIRPEKISFVEKGQCFSNQVEVTIEETIYLGNITTYKARLPGDGTELLIKQQNKDIVRRSKGEKIFLSWNERTIVLFRPVRP